MPTPLSGRPRGQSRETSRHCTGNFGIGTVHVPVFRLDPWSYLFDVLKRIGDHPVNALDELLPNNWKPAAA